MKGTPKVQKNTFQRQSLIFTEEMIVFHKIVIMIIILTVKMMMLIMVMITGKRSVHSYNFMTFSHINRDSEDD